MPKISVAIPVYNQLRRTLQELVARLSTTLSSLTEDYEIVFVDDGSVNDAWNTISELAAKDLRVKGFRLARNFGQHVAITAALDEVRGDWVIVMDADLQDRPEVIPDLYAKALEGFDVVFVNRIARPEPLHYRIVTACFYAFLNLLSGQSYNRLQGNFSIVSASAIRAFRSVRELNRFYGGILRWVGFRHASIDAQHAEADQGQSSYNLLRRLRFAFSIIVGFSTRLLYIAIGTGLVMALGSLMGAAIIIVEKISRPDYVIRGWPSVMTAIFFTAGITNVAIGLTGLYIGQILQQTKGRPLYIVASSTVYETGHRNTHEVR